MKLAKSLLHQSSDQQVAAEARAFEFNLYTPLMTSFLNLDASGEANTQLMIILMNAADGDLNAVSTTGNTARMLSLQSTTKRNWLSYILTDLEREGVMGRLPNICSSNFVPKSNRKFTIAAGSSTGA